MKWFDLNGAFEQLPRHRRRQVVLIGAVSIIGLITSAAALAQSVEGAPIVTMPGQIAPAPVAIATPETSAWTPESVQTATDPGATRAELTDEAAQSNHSVTASREDEAVDLPANTGATWSPTPVLDDGQYQGTSPQPGRSARPSSQAAANPSGIGSGNGLADYGDPAEGTAEQDNGIGSRLDRRERRVDPAKHTRIIALSRNLGALHGVRVRCGGRDDQTYRARMATLLDLEGPRGSTVRGDFVSAFNQGFNGQGRGAGPCTPEVESQEQALAHQGRRIALELADLYRPAIPAPEAAPAVSESSPAPGLAAPRR
jgi:uncharacterized protein (TIGR02301 family)